MLHTAVDDIEQILVATGGKTKQFVLTRSHIVPSSGSLVLILDWTSHNSECENDFSTCISAGACCPGFNSNSLFVQILI